MTTAAGQDQWAETAVGAVVLAAAAGFLIYALGHAGAGGKAGGYQVSARFGEVGALAPGADVRVAGVKVGAVSKVELDPKTFLAKATFSLDPDIQLPTDSTAKITSDGLLGGQHVSISPGGATDNLKAGGEIANTQGAVDLFGLIGRVLRPETPAQPPAAAAADPYPAGG
ncbi:MAG: outer membrane lipid asymmetry maintenance protein MlaD [Caulobacterales bacterium 32-69-10]|nr:MAG: outer membrane lipid asymmetry maintenance protein MlaD [Caulobacterales bacterium 32-69-10]